MKTFLPFPKISFLLLLFLGLELLHSSVYDSPDCGHCFFERCPRPEKCEAGIVRDKCGCCFECARKEGQLCDLPNSENGKFGSCGEDLDCKPRRDRPLFFETEDENVCYCRHDQTLCGSNGITYKNLCNLMEDAYRDHIKIKVVGRGPCDSAPWIHSSSKNVFNETGAELALNCEFRGYPIPDVEWLFVTPNGEKINLPSDDNHMAVLARGGPDKYQVTSWLQIQGLLETDAGEYICRGVNSYGKVDKNIRIQVYQKGDPRYQRLAKMK